MRVGLKLMGRQWLLAFTTKGFTKDPKTGKEGQGYCTHPDYPGRTIAINSRYRGKKVLSTVLHEYFHLVRWGLDEEEILQAEEDVWAIITQPEIMKLAGLQWANGKKK